MDELKVILVEDDTTWQRLLQEKLKQAFKQIGHLQDRVYLVESFADAYSQLSQNHWDLLVTDVGLGNPREESMRLGIQLIELARDRQIPAIAVSGSGEVTTQDVRNILVQYQASDFFSKQGFNTVDFINRVKQLLLNRHGLGFPIKILFLGANPIDTPQLRIGSEIRDIYEILRRGSVRENFSVETYTSVRPGDISQGILDFKPAIIHFSGHGTENGEILLENESGEIQPLSAINFAGYFARIQPQVPIHCLILNACHSAPLAQALATHLPYVIGMDIAISDAAAMKFAVGFYKALANHASIPEAYHQGCGEIQLYNLAEELTPKLYQR